MNRSTFKAAFFLLLAILAGYWGTASLGASGSFSHAFNSVVSVLLGAWIGWLIRDGDEA